jgi:hypothetical protein
MRSWCQSARNLGALLALGLMLALAGCDSRDQNAAQLADTLQTFVEDFARHALAALLF